MRTRPDIITRIDLPSGAVTVDEQGYLTDERLWTPDFAEYAANAEGIALTEAHYEVIGFIRDWQEEHGTMPDVRHLLNVFRKRDGVDKHGAKDMLYALFPGGYVKQAIKIAGMKQPRAWSTG